MHYASAVIAGGNGNCRQVCKSTKNARQVRLTNRVGRRGGASARRQDVLSFRECESLLKIRLLKLCLRRLIILITVFDIKPCGAGKAQGDEGDTSSFLSFSFGII